MYYRIDETLPILVSAEPDGSKPVIRYPGETLSMRLTVRVPPALKTEDGLPAVEAEVLTNMPDDDNKGGEWFTRSMVVEPLPPAVGSRMWKRPTDDEDSAPISVVFFVMLFPKQVGKFKYKLRARAKNVAGVSDEYQYFGGSAEKEFKVRVLPLDPDSKTWTAGPVAIEVHPNVYVGNFMAACNAPKFGFTALLNVAEELDDPVEMFKGTSTPIYYKKIGLPDGTINAISAENILACVRWIESRDSGKVLIHCRAGLGRSGSIAIAYKFKKSPFLSYDDILNQIWKLKPDITPHKGLQQTLESIKWD